MTDEGTGGLGEVRSKVVHTDPKGLLFLPVQTSLGGSLDQHPLESAAIPSSVDFKKRKKTLKKQTDFL